MIRWTKQEEETLKKLWASASWNAIEKALPKYTRNAIQHKACNLKLKRFAEFDWSDQEFATLISAWVKNMPRDQVENMLPGRSWAAIKSKACVLGLKQIKIERPIVQGKTTNIDKIVKGNALRIGIVSDTHIGSRYAQITYLKKFYELCEREGVDFMIHAGDLCDGNGTHYKGQLHEIHLIGADNTFKFVCNNFPNYKARNGKQGVTYIVEGFHDLDWWTKEGYDLVKSVCEKRKDIVCLGHAQAVLEVQNKKIMIVHPSGGTSYALSYKAQKRAESFSSENKPHIIISGHFHKALYIPLLRNIYYIEAGSFQAQTPFAIRKGISFHYGGWILEIGFSKEGITNLKAEFIPFYRPIEGDYANYR